MSLILSLDLKSLERAKYLIESVIPCASHIKIGHIALSNFDVAALSEIPLGVMLDLKFFDILSTVKEAILGYQRMIPKMRCFTISAACQDDVIKMSLQHDAKPFFVLHLSSDTVAVDVASKVLEKAENIVRLGGDRFICPPFLIENFRKNFGDKVTLATPGVREKCDSNDHASVVGPADAKKLGTDFIIVGRPIISATDPTKTARDYYDKFVSA